MAGILPAAIQQHESLTQQHDAQLRHHALHQIRGEVLAVTRKQRQVRAGKADTLLAWEQLNSRAYRQLYLHFTLG